MAGFVSKWYLGIGALAAGEGWVLLVLATSSLLNAAYFLPIVHVAFFRPTREEWRSRQDGDGGFEARALLLFPPVATAMLALAAGLFAGLWFSPLGLAMTAVAEIYAP
jgi:multicomponent Na+:H+ antiporter subunit D